MDPQSTLTAVRWLLSIYTSAHMGLSTFSIRVVVFCLDFLHQAASIRIVSASSCLVFAMFGKVGVRRTGTGGHSKSTAYELLPHEGSQVYRSTGPG